ncbi:MULTISPECIES: cytochrome P450 [Nostocales]|uniref:Cytochrome P450 n=4 Tax=Cyanophyceae TaxID=3028117 RepID=A0A0C1N5U5_9CYAN|nr:cytochrome P450 [Tolypothrix bouteillei]KAF3890914.1 cytochrome P450 [Tolypothrix bouteillei VB521301]
MKLPQGPKTPAWLLRMQFAANPLAWMDTLSKRYGDIFTIVSGSTPIVFVGNSQGMKQIFTSTEIVAAGELNQGAAPLVGNNGLLLLDGLRHRHRRKLLMPPLHGNRIQVYGQRICAITDTVMSQYQAGKAFLSYPTMQTITVQVILDTLLGLQTGERYEQFRQLLPTLMNYARSALVETSLSFRFLQQDLGRWSPWGYFLYLWRQFDQLLYAEINERRHLQASNSTSLYTESTDVLSELIFACDETGQRMTNEDVRDLLPSLLFGGRDASATAITWALYWIHSLPTVRDRLLKELDSLGESSDPLRIVELPYLSAVCHEALRIYPTQIVTFPRRVESPVELMGYELSPGTLLFGCIYLTHQNSDLYPQPKLFQPERFLERQFSPYEFLPFGGGARRCPGEALALFEMKLVLATILSHYQLALAKKQPEQPKAQGANYPPASGLKMVMLGQRKSLEKSQQFISSSV